jgi:ferric-dicitrate binding protein FerR (iron transport regulator)
MNERLQYLVQKHFEGKLTLKENIEFSESLADQKNLDVEHLLDDAWQSQLKSEFTLNRNFSSILDKVHHHIRLNEIIKPKQFSWALTFQRVAAILIIPLLLSFVAYWNFEKTKPAENISYAEIQCPLGVRTKFQLPDGSTGFLNSGSKLKYPVVFSKQRIVELSGEAYFEVVHNQDIPFHVKTRNLDIKVLGTTFNVIANEDEKIEEIVLQNGKVNVLSKNGKQLSVLLPNEQLTLNTENLTFTKKGVIATQYTSWKEGKLVFRNENMQQVACRLSRWYNVEVMVDDRLLDDYTFHATFIDEPLDEVLKLISITTPITYKEERRISDKEGIYLKRKIILKINKLKINQFK